MFYYVWLFCKYMIICVYIHMMICVYININLCVYIYRYTGDMYISICTYNVFLFIKVPLD